MKYKAGDHVKIRSLDWWNKHPKNSKGDVVFELDHIAISSIKFTKERAEKNCGRICEILENRNFATPYVLHFGNTRWDVLEDWIEGKVRKLNIHLKLMRNEI